jgi:hypothetical protein
MTEESPDTDLKLAEDLGSRVGRTQGSAILDLVKARLLLIKHKEGHQTSEFKLSVVLISAGLIILMLGVWHDDSALQSQGIELAKIVGAGYAASRGLAKLGLSLTKDKPQ